MNEKDTSRLEAFSDGVFAIAITLLVLELKVPHLGEEATADALKKALLAQWPSYMAYIGSFFTILVMWINHHRVFMLIKRGDSRFMMANGFLLMCITVVPFPTNLLADYFNTPAAKLASAIYYGTYVMLALGYNLMWLAARKGDHLLRESVTKEQAAVVTKSFLFGMPSYLVNLLIALINPILGIVVFFALWIFWAVVSYENRD